jgi:HAMP domain-containing protein
MASDAESEVTYGKDPTKAVLSVLGPTYTTAALAVVVVVLLATIGILEETSDAIAILRRRAEYGDPDRDTEETDGE